MPKTQLVQKYSTRLLNATEYREKLARGKKLDQTMEQYVDDLNRCYKIDEAGEKERLMTDYRLELEEIHETMQPTTTPLTPARMQPSEAMSDTWKGCCKCAV